LRVRLKGINSVRARLADGTTVTYWYAWKGGPRLKGQPGTPEFIASYNEAVARKRPVGEGTLLALLNSYQSSAEFQALSEYTRRDYLKHIKAIEAEFADFPLTALSDKRTRGEFLAWRDRLAERSRRQADYAIAVLARVLAWGVDRGLIDANPAARATKLYRSKRIDRVWTPDDEEAFLAKAPEHLRLALILALWTGQRQGDLLRLPWSAYDGQRIRLTQRKTRARVSIPVGTPLKTLLDATPRRAVTILTTEHGQTWTESGFRASWRTACRRAGITGLTFHDLRGTAVTRLALAGCSEAEIATITGHSLRDVGAILDAHYLKRDDGLGTSAIRKLEEHESRTKTPK
jgi:integrase